jgi:hypothetical protein
MGLFLQLHPGYPRQRLGGPGRLVLARAFRLSQAKRGLIRDCNWSETSPAFTAPSVTLFTASFDRRHAGRVPRGLLNDFVRGLKQSDLHSSRHRCLYG